MLVLFGLLCIASAFPLHPFPNALDTFPAFACRLRGQARCPSVAEVAAEIGGPLNAITPRSKRQQSNEGTLDNTPDVNASTIAQYVEFAISVITSDEAGIRSIAVLSEESLETQFIALKAILTPLRELSGSPAVSLSLLSASARSSLDAWLAYSVRSDIEQVGVTARGLSALVESLGILYGWDEELAADDGRDDDSFVAPGAPVAEALVQDGAGATSSLTNADGTLLDRGTLLRSVIEAATRSRASRFVSGIATERYEASDGSLTLHVGGADLRYMQADTAVFVDTQLDANISLSQEALVRIREESGLRDVRFGFVQTRHNVYQAKSRRTVYSAAAVTGLSVYTQDAAPVRVRGLDAGRGERVLVSLRISPKFAFDPTEVRGVCEYWADARADWLKDGCVTLEFNKERVLCLCSHLTDFTAILETDQIELPRGPGTRTADLQEQETQAFSVNWVILLILLFLWLLLCCVGLLILYHRRRRNAAEVDDLAPYLAAAAAGGSAAVLAADVSSVSASSEREARDHTPLSHTRGARAASHASDVDRSDYSFSVES